MVSRAVQLGRVVVADGRRDAALRVAGVALPGICFGEDDDVTSVGEGDGGAQAGNAAADHQEVAADAHGVILPMRTANRRIAGFGAAGSSDA